MGKILRTKVKGMGWKAKAGLISLFTLLLTVGMYQGWYGLLHTEAAPVGGNAWTSVYAGTAYPNNSNYTLTIPSGQNRLLVVAIASTRTTAGAVSITTPTFGTRALTLAAGDAASTTTWNHTALYYLKEADLAAASNSTLNLTISGGTSYYNYVYYRVYTGVDQSSPLNDSKNFNSNGTTSANVGPFSPLLSIGANDQAIEIINLARSSSGTTGRTISTWATGWTTAGIAPSGIITSGPCAQLYIRDRAVVTSATTDGSQHTSSSTSTWKSMTAMSLKPAPTSTTLTVSGNTPIASGTRLDTDQGVLMQRLQVTGSGQLELNSLTMNNTGTATTIGSAEIYISPTSQTTLPADAVLIGNATNWGGASTQLSLTGGTQANRTLGGTQPLTKYVYIVYDMSAGQAGYTVGSRVTAVGVVSPNTGSTGLSLSSNTLTLNRSGNVLTAIGNIPGRTTAKDSDAAVVMQHFQVDCDAAFDNALQIDSLTIEDLGTAAMIDDVKIYISPVQDADPTVLPATAKLIGHTGEWAKTSTTIDFNAYDPGTTADRTVIAAGTTGGASKYLYVVYSMHYEDVFVAGKTVQAKVTGVGVASPDAGLGNLSFLSNSITLTRGTWSKITACGGCHDTANIVDGTARNVPDGKFIGSHNKHTTVIGFDCSVCHVKPTVFNHANGFVNLTGAVGRGYSKTKAFAVSNTPVMGTCSGIYCHSNGTSVSTGTIQSTQSPAWGSTTTCSSCPGFPPAYVSGTPKPNTHGAGGHNIGCDKCHYSVTTNGTSITTPGNHGNSSYNVSPNTGAGVSFTYTYATTGGTCSTNGCHGDVAWGGSLGCIECHNKVITRTKGRPGKTLANAVAEFGLAWGHKKSGRGAVTSADCIVCHLEGNGTTGRTTTYHQDGNIDLRDPDGTGETPITNISNTAWVFQRFSTSYGSLTRTATGHTLNNIDNIITQKFCLKCHDSDGATNPSARTTGGTQYMPWGGVNLGTNYSVANGAAAAGGIVNVAAQLATANASAHPVVGPRNRAYGTPAKFNAPYNNFTRTAGTKSNGVVIYCFDCHNTATTPLTTRTITAHGNAVTLRGNVWANPSSLCTTCHIMTGSGGNHGTGSAITSSTNSSMQTYMNTQCHYCHSSNTTSPVRPIRAQDVHGFDLFASTAPAGDTMWPKGATNTYKPYVFFRNTVNWGGTTGGWKPLSGPSVPTGSATCGGSVTTSSGCTGENMSTYTPGGAY